MVFAAEWMAETSENFLVLLLMKVKTSPFVGSKSPWNSKKSMVKGESLREKSPQVLTLVSVWHNGVQWLLRELISIC